MENPEFVIEKVEIKGLFGKHDLDWELHPDVNILAGMNGIGKSTILEGIASTVAFDKFVQVKNIDSIKKLRPRRRQKRRYYIKKIENVIIKELLLVVVGKMNN